ncbi:MAG: pitrilysin family protein [Candidatus Aminicenantes bacterium]|nr:pitrilysin family protein [Candidatus Aminicenantes bacterium]
MKTRTRILPLLVLVLLTVSLAQAAFKLPAPEKLTLKNGIVVYFLKTTEVPLISFRLNLKGAGSAQEPAEFEGIAALTADQIMKGTAKMGADAVSEALDFMGARLGFSASDEYAAISADCLSEHFPKVLEIASACLTEPAFLDDEFKKAREIRLNGLKSVKDNPGSAVRNYFTKAYFGTHPLGHFASGTEESLAKMTAADVRAYYKKYYGSKGAIGALVGNIEKKQALALLNAAFGGWKGANAPASTLPPLPEPKGIKLLLIDKPDATQAYWILGAPGYALGDKITPQATVMNTLFGGRFTSWLSTEMRIKRGLTYGAGSNFQTYRIGGLFQANSYTRNEKIGEMLDILFDLLKKVGNEGFTAEEIESSRNYVLGQFPPTLETNAAKAGTYVRLAFNNLGFDYYDKYLAGIRAVTQAAAKEAAVKLIPTENYVLVVVGKADEIRDQLKKYGTWTEKKISDPGF